MDIATENGVTETPVTPDTPLTPMSPAFFFETPDLTQPDDFSDVTLCVEEERLYTCRGIMASASPVWRKMFTCDFKEKEAREVPLPGKKFVEVHELLLCISPAIQKPITGDNVMHILPLADEYQMAKLKSDCENWLLCQLNLVPTHHQHLKYLGIAQQYRLDRLLERSVELLSELSVEDLEQHPDYSNIEQDTLVRILRNRVHGLEKAHSKTNKSNDTWRKKCEELEDCLKKMSREKLTIKRTLDEIDGAWELKGSDARCIDPVHIYGPRDLTCKTCTKQMQTYIQGKLHFLLNRGSNWAGITWPQ